MTTTSLIKSNFVKIRLKKPDFSFFNKALLSDQLVLKNYHFWGSSFCLHVLIIIPIFLELFIYHKTIDNKPLEEIIYLTFEKNTLQNNQKQKKQRNEIDYHSRTKNTESAISQQQKQASKAEQQKILKRYEDQLSNHVGIVLEQQVDNYNINGNFTVQFSIKKNGKITNVVLADKAEDELSNHNLLKILKQIQKFHPIPGNLPQNKTYHFHVPIEIEQD